MKDDSSLNSFVKRMWELHGEKVRYLAVGVWNTIFSYLLFLLLLETLGPTIRTLESSQFALVQWVGQQYYLVVGWIGWIVGVPQSTLTMKYLVFRSKGNVLREVGKAFFIYLPSQGIGTVVLWFSVRVLHMSPPIGALATILITTVFSYIGHKYFTFRTPLEIGEIVDQQLLQGDKR